VRHPGKCLLNASDIPITTRFHTANEVSNYAQLCDIRGRRIHKGITSKKPANKPVVKKTKLWRASWYHPGLLVTNLAHRVTLFALLGSKKTLASRRHYSKFDAWLHTIISLGEI
jgi:hypothetical protein